MTDDPLTAAQALTIVEQAQSIADKKLGLLRSVLEKRRGKGEEMTDELVKQLRMDWDTAQSVLSEVLSWHNQRRLAADRIDALTAERDHAWTMVAQADTQMGQSLADHLQTKAERDRLREALTELLEVSRRAVRLSVEHDNFKLYAMEPMEQAILLSRAALKGETP